MSAETSAVVVAISRDSRHRFTKPAVDEIMLVAGIGIEGDAHCGVTVQHRSRVVSDPTQPNLRQVHLIHAELHDELRARGFEIAPGQMGENVTTRGLRLLNLPIGTILRLGLDAVVRVTGLRNPCAQLNAFRSDLLRAVLERDDQRRLVRKAGIMGVVLHGGPVKPGDVIGVDLPDKPHHPLAPV